MERLTRRNEGDSAYYYPNCFKECDGVGYSSKCDKCGFQDEVCEKLGEYEDLDEQGLLLKLPCKVGDYIWDNDYGKPCSYEVTGFSFGNLNQGDWEDETAFDQVLVYYTNSNGSITGIFAVSEIGKTVFLTQAEAEEALKGMEAAK